MTSSFILQNPSQALPSLRLIGPRLRRHHVPMRIENEAKAWDRGDGIERIQGRGAQEQVVHSDHDPQLSRNFPQGSHGPWSLRARNLPKAEARATLFGVDPLSPTQHMPRTTGLDTRNVNCKEQMLLGMGCNQLVREQHGCHLLSSMITIHDDLAHG